MNLDERMEFLKRSAESHDRQIAAIVRASNENSDKIRALLRVA